MNFVARITGKTVPKNGRRLRGDSEKQKNDTTESEVHHSVSDGSAAVVLSEIVLEGLNPLTTTPDTAPM